MTRITVVTGNDTKTTLDYAHELLVKFKDLYRDSTITLVNTSDHLRNGSGRNSYDQFWHVMMDEIQWSENSHTVLVANVKNPTEAVFINDLFLDENDNIEVYLVVKLITADVRKMIESDYSTKYKVQEIVERVKSHTYQEQGSYKRNLLPETLYHVVKTHYVS